METHTPVLLRETIAALSIAPGDTVLDATIGTAGHAQCMLNELKRGTFVGIDADSTALGGAKARLIVPEHVTAHVVEGNFRHIADISSDLGIQTYDAILADFGWGVHQIQSGRGFSFRGDEPLIMCYSTRKNGCSLTATEIVNTFEKEKIADIIREYGEERWADRIADHIVTARAEKYITTSRQLADIVSGAIPRKMHPRNVHAATRTFQAIRIAVNDELEALRDFLGALPALMHRGSRTVMLSFHSLEDRIVKQTFRAWENGGIGHRNGKKAVRASSEEQSANPRSRSAVLRTFTHI